MPINLQRVIFVLVIIRFVAEKRFLRFVVEDVVIPLAILIILVIAIPLVILITPLFSIVRMVVAAVVLAEFIVSIIVFTNEDVFQSFPIFATEDLQFHEPYDAAIVVNAPIV